MWFRILCASIMALTVTGCAHVPQVEDYSTVPPALRRTAYTDGRLWLLDQSGTLFSLAETDKAARQEPLPDRVVDFCIRDGRPMALAGGYDAPSVTLYQHDGHEWRAVQSIQHENDYLQVLDCSAEAPLVIGSRHAIRLNNGGETRLKFKVNFLRNSKFENLLVATYQHDGQLYIGEDRGEWGGGLHRIDLRDGSVTTLGEITDNGCGGKLNSECEVATGIVGMPGEPGCLAVASGLMHGGGSGRIYRICGDEVSVLYEKRYRDNEYADPAAYDTVRFLNLFRQGGRLMGYRP